MTIKIETVIFDLGGVLIEVDQASAVDWLVERGCQFGAIEEFVEQTGMALHERGELSAADFLARVNKLLPQPESTMTLKDWWTGFFRPRDEMLALARALRASHRVFILSNTGPLHWQQALEQFALADLADDALTSFEIGIAKPEAGIYAAAEKRFVLDPAQTVFIDDLEANISAAVAAGWHGIHHRGFDTTCASLAALGVTPSAASSSV